MKQNENLVSIILPVYNGSEYLSQALDSCLNQTYKNFELIIVNDCSVDNSLEIIEKYAQNDGRIIVCSNPVNLGLPTSLNIGHKLANGSMMTWTSDDNILQVNFLDKLVNALKAQQVPIVYSSYQIINDKSSVISSATNLNMNRLLFSNTIGCSFLYKRNVYYDLKGYQEDLFLVEDYAFWLFASLSYPMYFVDENLYDYRHHKSSLTSDIENKNFDRFYEVKKKLLERFGHKLNWQDITLNLIFKIHCQEPIKLMDYLSSLPTIKKDILTYRDKSFVNNPNVYQECLNTLRVHLFQNTANHNFKTLKNVLWYSPIILLSKKRSVRKTLRLIKKSIFVY